MYLVRKGGSIVTSFFPSTRWGSFIVGAGAAAFGAALVRPVLVAAVRTGYGLTQFASEALEQAKAEAASIKAEAAKPGTDTSADLASEIRKLRAEVAALKGQAPATKS